MRSKLVVVTGTGTEIGKTHIAVALVRVWSRSGSQVVGLKPVESGAEPPEGPDARALREAGSFHVKHPPPYVFTAPISPHLAAADAGRRIDFATIREYVAAHRAESNVLVELPGGMFSPLAPGSSHSTNESREIRGIGRPALTNADLIASLVPDVVLLVAPDRLGVLHDLTATVLAARSLGLTVHAIAFSAPERPDASTSRNASEFTFGIPVAATFPRSNDPSETERAAVAALRALRVLPNDATAV